MNFNDYIKKTDICFTNDDFELQASFNNEKTAQLFKEYLRNRYGENEQSKTDFRGMPFMKFKMDDKNEIVLCGKEPATLCAIAETYITVLNKPIISETDNVGIKTISW